MLKLEHAMVEIHGFRRNTRRCAELLFFCFSASGL